MMGSVHESRQKHGFHDASHDGFHNGFHANNMKAWGDGLWWQDDGLWWLVTYYEPPRMLCMVVLFVRADDGEPAYRVGLCSKQHGTKELSIGRILEVKGGQSFRVSGLVGGFEHVHLFNHWSSFYPIDIPLALVFFKKNDPNWLIFFRGVEATNQHWYFSRRALDEIKASKHPDTDFQGSWSWRDPTTFQVKQVWARIIAVGWWFQTRTLCSMIYGMSSFPLTSYFSEGLKPPTSCAWMV